jgi:hypothetical protein
MLFIKAASCVDPTARGEVDEDGEGGLKGRLFCLDWTVLSSPSSGDMLAVRSQSLADLEVFFFGEADVGWPLDWPKMEFGGEFIVCRKRDCACRATRGGFGSSTFSEEGD